MVDHINLLLLLTCAVFCANTSSLHAAVPYDGSLEEHGVESNLDDAEHAGSAGSGDEETDLEPLSGDASIDEDKRNGYQKMIRFGKRGKFDKMIRFGKKAKYDKMIRFGKRGKYDKMIRFGKRGKYDKMIRFGKRGKYNKMIRFGKRGKYDKMIRFGKKSNLSEEHTDPISTLPENYFQEEEAMPFPGQEGRAEDKRGGYEKMIRFG